MLLRPFSLLVLLAAVQAAPLAAAGPPALVADINTTESSHDSSTGITGSLLRLGSKVLFAAWNSSSGSELWSSDGTAVGTGLLRDICPGACSSSPELLGTTGGNAVFFTGEVFDPQELWRSDGTREGTSRINTSLSRCFNAFTQSTEVGGVVVFTARSPEAECGLWRTDGTEAGTRLLVRIPLFRDHPLIEGPERAGNKLFFLTEGETGGVVLWRTDGTEAGTFHLGSFAEDDEAVNGRPRSLTSDGARIFFVAERGSEGEELWTSDGTAAGTRPVTQFIPEGPFQPPLTLKVFDGIAYFVADDITGGSDLWRSDGTAAGTRRVTDFGYANPFGLGSEPGPLPLAKAGNRLVFVATDGLTPRQFWTSGGTPATTAPLTGCPGGCPAAEFSSELVTLGNRAILTGRDPAVGVELWSTDGTGAGTRRLRDLCPGACSSEPSDFIPALGRLFFLGGVVGAGEVLWSTDGTSQGTLRLATLGFDAFDPPFTPPFSLVTVGQKIFFAAGFAPVILSRGRQLWTSDGTPEGSGLVTLLGSDAPGSFPHELTPFGSDLLFFAFQGQEHSLWRSGGTAASTVPLRSTTVDAFSSTRYQDLALAGTLAFFFREEPFSIERRLWRSDGTDTGTFPVSPPGQSQLANLQAFQGKAVFTTSSNNPLSSSFWESDGTVAGTRKLFDLPPNSFGPYAVKAFGNELYFLANAGESSDDVQVWASDGTSGGTRKLTAFDTFAFDRDNLPEMVKAGSRVYFVANKNFVGPRLWVTNGTATGTSDLQLPGIEAALPLSLVEFQGQVYFTGHTEQGTLGRGLWKSDGTVPGTVLVKPVAPRYDFNLFRQEPAWTTPVGPHLYFAAEDGAHGLELWRTDGTPEGTVLVRDIAPGSASSYPRELVAAGGRLYFRATNGNHGFELWESDGTAAGTRMVQDLQPGGLSSHPEELTEAGGRLFFRADDGLSGSELWSLPLAGPPGCQPSDQALCLGNGRFRVEATWRDFQGNSGRGHAVAVTADTGYLWFFDSANVEVILKVLDGRGVNDHHWVFYGALSSVEYTLTVTDTQTGAARRYVNPPSRLGSVADTTAFGPKGATGSALSLGPAAVEWAPLSVEAMNAVAAPCVPSATRLCLQDGRFAVEATWRDFQGNTGVGKAVPLSGGDTGYFWFFNQDNVEVVLKVLDGRPLNNKFWVFYGALSSVQYTLTVTDTETGKVKKYENPSGRLASVADTGAF
jgi:ELWxxDGT repeat protein